ncbi:hypothetical protein MKW94_009364 [Papaver nudicaule]|uniref:RING-type domain-containing protein n=1 Tax=Papaver nudicaule TaxID=74823 RepID=A0AA41V9M1_PAPNU|nr:hypothetical protein [Papaver nudicaule]
MSRVRSPSEYELHVHTRNTETDPVYQILLNVRSRQQDYSEVARINFFSETGHIRSQLVNLFSRIEVLDENYTRGLSTEIAFRINEALMLQTSEVSVDFRVDIRRLLTERIAPDEEHEQQEEFQPDFDTDDESYNGIRRNPLSRSEISKLNKTEYAGESGEPCMICIEEFYKKEVVITLGCLHVFHSGCLLRWIEENRTCPLCRRSVVDSNKTEASSKRG